MLCPRNMRGRFAILIMLLTSVPVSAGPASRPTTRAVSNDARIAGLIVQLGDQDPALRDQASGQLKEMFPVALTALKQAAKSEDPEIAARAQSLLDITDALPADVRKDIQGWSGGFCDNTTYFETEIQNGSGYIVESVIVTLRLTNRPQGREILRRVMLVPVGGPIPPGVIGKLRGNVGELCSADDNCNWTIELIRGKRAK
jgi:hypothetical protein